MYGIVHVIPVAGAAVGTVLIDPGNPASVALAFTGLALGLYLAIGVGLLAAGLLLRYLGRRSAPRSPRS